MRERARDAVLVIGFPAVSGGLSPRLIALGYRPISVSDPPAAAARLARENEAVHAAIVPTNAPFLTPGALWRLTRANGRSALSVLALGPRDDDGHAERLRRAGVRFTLWEPYADRELRFALNRALHDDAHGQSRLHARASTDMVARIRLGAREKAGLIYSLSPLGCYVETDRPCVPDSYVSLHLPLPNGGVELPARVLYANVPGDFARANLPRGMALGFLEPSVPVRVAIARYVADRLGDIGLRPEGDAAVTKSQMARVWSRVRAMISPAPASRVPSPS
jgi:hypothetical protein